LQECKQEVKNKHWNEPPLHLASRNEHFEIVKFLVEKGANKESKEFYGETPLHSAARNGHLKLSNIFEKAVPTFKLRQTMVIHPLTWHLKMFMQMLSTFSKTKEQRMLHNYKKKPLT
jgi:hypothetical protein